MAERRSILATFGGPRRVVLLLVGFVVATGFYHWQTSAGEDAMRVVGSELGLRVSEQGQRRQLRGSVGDVGVAVVTTTENRGGDTHWFTDFELSAPGQPLGRIVGASLRQKLIGGMQDSEWLRTGDSDFDGAVLVEGDPAVLLAHLDVEARAAVMAAADVGWTLEGGTWSARKSGRLTSAKKIRHVLDLGLEAAESMRIEDDPGTSIPAQVETETEPVTPENVEEALDELYTPRSLEAALLLARARDFRQMVRTRLVSAVLSGERTDEVLDVLAEVGGQSEIHVLGSVTGEHEAAAKAAIARIEARLSDDERSPVEP